MRRQEEVLVYADLLVHAVGIRWREVEDVALVECGLGAQELVVGNQLLKLQRRLVLIYFYSVTLFIVPLLCRPFVLLLLLLKRRMQTIFHFLLLAHQDIFELGRDHGLTLYANSFLL